MKLYGLKSCDTCRKALRALENAGHAVDFVDVRAEAVPDAVMARARTQFGGKLLNRASTTWRGLAETERAEPEEALLARHPALMKRPLIEAGGDLYLGWDEAVRNALLDKG